ncbi:MAG: hypothetical protein SGILL_001997 [Bacillariaceae sp.]
MVGDGTGTRQVALFFDANPSLYESSPIYYTNEDAAWIEFCARISLYSEDSILTNWLDLDFHFDLELVTAIGVRKLESELLLSQSNEAPVGSDRRRRLVECSEGYDVVFDEMVPAETPVPTSGGTNEGSKMYGEEEEESGGIVNTESSGPLNITRDTLNFNPEDFYNVNAFLCDDNSTALTDQERESIHIANGGVVVRVCVERNAKCVRDHVYMRRIDAFSFFQDFTRQDAVVAVNTPSPDNLTELFCEPGSHMCHFETVLQAEFFERLGTVEGLGSASLQFGASPNGRELQANTDDIATVRGFRLTFSVTEELTFWDEYGIIVYSVAGGVLAMAVGIMTWIWCRRKRSMQTTEPTPKDEEPSDVQIVRGYDVEEGFEKLKDPDKHGKDCDMSVETMPTVAASVSSSSSTKASKKKLKKGRRKSKKHESMMNDVVEEEEAEDEYVLVVDEAPKKKKSKKEKKRKWRRSEKRRKEKEDTEIESAPSTPSQTESSTCTPSNMGSLVSRTHACGNLQRLVGDIGSGSTHSARSVRSSSSRKAARKLSVSNSTDYWVQAVDN